MQPSPALARRSGAAGKGKARQPCEFGVKASVAVTHRHGLMVGARSFPENPYDGRRPA